MYGQIDIYINNDIDDIHYDVSVFGGNCYTISVYMNQNLDYNDIFKHNDLFCNAIKTCIRNNMLFDDFEDDYTFKLLEKHIKGEINLFDEVKAIRLFKTKNTSIFDMKYDDHSFTFDEIKDYYKKNNIKNMRTVINDVYGLSVNDYNNIVNSYGDFLDNLLFYMEGNSSPLSIDEYKKVLDRIDEISKYIKSLGFSPMEQIMYTYDLVRNRVYTSEDETKETSISSRDLSSVLFGNNIVCAGYAQLFSAILSQLGFDKQAVYHLSSRGNRYGHAKNIAYVKDDKYNIEGIYFFDPTGDSREKDDHNNLFLTHYYYFAKILKDTKQDDEEYNLQDRNLYYVTSDMLIDFISIINKGEFDKIDYRTASALHYFGKLMYNEDTISNYYCFNDKCKNLRYGYSSEIDKNLVIDRAFEFDKLLDKKIKTIDFLKILYNVRKQQYYESDEFIPFGVKSLIYTLEASNKCQNDDPFYYFLGIMGIKAYSNYENITFDKNELLTMMKQNGIILDMQRVKLTKVLSKIKK